MIPHDYPPGAWICASCGCAAGSLESRLPCKPDRQAAETAQTKREIDWLALNKGAAAQ